MAAVDIREKNRSSKEEANQLSTVAEGLPALGWVTMVNSNFVSFVFCFNRRLMFSCCLLFLLIYRIVNLDLSLVISKNLLNFMLIELSRIIKNRKKYPTFITIIIELP